MQDQRLPLTPCMYGEGEAATPSHQEQVIYETLDLTHTRLAHKLPVNIDKRKTHTFSSPLSGSVGLKGCIISQTQEVLGPLQRLE